MSKEEIDDMRMSTITYAPHNSSPLWLQLRCVPLITYYNIVLQSIYICVKSNFHKNWNLVFLMSFWWQKNSKYNSSCIIGVKITRPPWGMGAHTNWGACNQERNHTFPTIFDFNSYWVFSYENTQNSITPALQV
jgi:hypothetical protein